MLHDSENAIDIENGLLSRAARRSNASCRLLSIRCLCSTLKVWQQTSRAIKTWIAAKLLSLKSSSHANQTTFRHSENCHSN